MLRWDETFLAKIWVFLSKSLVFELQPFHSSNRDFHIACHKQWATCMWEGNGFCVCVCLCVGVCYVHCMKLDMTACLKTHHSSRLNFNYIAYVSISVFCIPSLLSTRVWSLLTPTAILETTELLRLHERVPPSLIRIINWTMKSSS